MSSEINSIEKAIKNKIVEIVAQLGGDARNLGNDELIPASGLIDSVGLLELLAWYEHYFDILLSQEEITIDNLGSIHLMANFVLVCKGLS
jgi:acyl carrier protein